MTLFAIVAIKAGWLFDVPGTVGHAAIPALNEWGRMGQERAWVIGKDTVLKCTVEVTFHVQDTAALSQLAGTCSTYGLEMTRIT